MLYAKLHANPFNPPLKRLCVSSGIKDSTGSESDGGDSSSLRSDTGSVSSSSEIQPKKVRGFGFGDIFKDQPIKLRPRSMDMDNEAEKVRNIGICVLMKQKNCVCVFFSVFTTLFLSNYSQAVSILVPCVHSAFGPMVSRSLKPSCLPVPLRVACIPLLISSFSLSIVGSL